MWQQITTPFLHHFFPPPISVDLDIVFCVCFVADIVLLTMEAVLKEFDRLSKSKGFAKCEALIDKFLECLEKAKIAITIGK